MQVRPLVVVVVVDLPCCVFMYVCQQQWRKVRKDEVREQSLQTSF